MSSLRDYLRQQSPRAWVASITTQAVFLLATDRRVHYQRRIEGGQTLWLSLPPPKVGRLVEVFGATIAPLGGRAIQQSSRVLAQVRSGKPVLFMPVDGLTSARAPLGSQSRAVSSQAHPPSIGQVGEAAALVVSVHDQNAGCECALLLDGDNAPKRVPLSALLESHVAVNLVWEPEMPSVTTVLAGALSSDRIAVPREETLVPARTSAPGLVAVRQLAVDLHIWRDQLQAAQMDGALLELATSIQTPNGVAQGRRDMARGLTDLRDLLPPLALPAVDEAIAELEICATIWHRIARLAVAEEPPLARCVRVGAVACQLYRAEASAEGALDRLASAFAADGRLP